MALTLRVLIRRWVAYLVGVACFGGIVFFSLIEPNLSSPVASDEERPDFLFEDIRLLQLDAGRVVWDMTAGVAAVKKSDHVAHLRHVKGVFYSREGYSVFNVQAPSCVLDLTSSDLVLSSARSVFFQAKAPVRLTATSLVWKAVSQQFFGTGKVTISTPGFLVLGDSFKVDIPSQHLEISDNSHAEIVPGEVRL